MDITSLYSVGSEYIKNAANSSKLTGDSDTASFDSLLTAAIIPTASLPVTVITAFIFISNLSDKFYIVILYHKFEFFSIVKQMSEF